MSDIVRVSDEELAEQINVLVSEEWSELDADIVLSAFRELQRHRSSHLSGYRHGREDAARVESIIEEILFRRVVERRIEGFTLEASKEIAAAIRSLPDKSESEQGVGKVQG